MQKATARAHANIALAKYWGKRDQDLILPFFDSVSVTLDAFFTTTTVSFGEQDSDSLTLDNELFFEGSKEFDHNVLDNFKHHTRTKLICSSCVAMTTAREHTLKA